jgi:hypothetical protein
MSKMTKNVALRLSDKIAWDLESFLFEASRQSLMFIGEGLRRIDGGHCFYCGSKVQAVDVDHVVPFSLYPRDLTHNFVISHPSCNRSKSDTIAAKPHLERWLEHITRNDDALKEIGEAAGRNADLAATPKKSGDSDAAKKFGDLFGGGD